MDAILGAVDGAGVARQDVRTSLLSVQPRYDYRDGRAPTLTGYELANVVEVTVRDLATLGRRGRRDARGGRDEHGRPVVPGRRSGARRARGAASGDGARPAPGPTSLPRRPA